MTIDNSNEEQHTPSAGSGEGPDSVQDEALKTARKSGSEAMCEGEIPANKNEESDEDFEKPVRSEPAHGARSDDLDVDALIVDLEGYEGPLDVLLEMARSQKVDIRKISMVALVDQYLKFIEAARQKNLELAADYLVMASWLTFLKTKLLLPLPESDSAEPTADEMAARLAFQLQRLEAMRKATQDLFALPQMGMDMFTRGMPEGVRVVRTPLWQADLFDLLKAYAVQRVANVERNYVPEKPKVFSLEEARARIGRILGMIPEWSELATIVPFSEIDAPRTSVMSGAFHAALELAKEGRIDLRQGGAFAPIFVRKRDEADRDPENGNGTLREDDNVRPLSGPGSRGGFGERKKPKSEDAASDSEDVTDAFDGSDDDGVDAETDNNLTQERVAL